MKMSDLEKAESFLLEAAGRSSSPIKKVNSIVQVGTATEIEFQCEDGSTSGMILGSDAMEAVKEIGK